MSFDDALYARDDEMDEFGDSGAYGDSLEEDYEEEEEEEEAEVPGMIEPQPEPATPAPAAEPPGVFSRLHAANISNTPRMAPACHIRIAVL